MRTSLSRALTALALTVCAASALAAPTAERFVLRMRGAEENGYRPPVVTAVAISADGRRVAAAGDDHRLRVWDAESGAEVETLEGHNDWVRGARFSSDGTRLATVAADHTVCLWNLTNDQAGLAVRQLTNGPLQAVAWRPDGQALATAGYGDALRLFDLTSSDSEPTEMGCPCEDMRAVAFSPDGRWVAAAGRNGVLRMWDTVASGAPRDLPSDGRRVRALAFSPDGDVLAAGGDGPVVRLWRREADGFGSPDDLLVRPGKVHALAFVDDNLLAIGDTQNEVRLWETDTRSPRVTLRGHTGTVAALAASADGRRLVTGSFDTTMRVWDLDPAAMPAPTAALPNTETYLR